MNEHQKLCAEIITRLKSRGETLAIAESCTGGMVCEWITEIAGASEIFLGGFVAYSNDAKTNVLGVPERILKNQGAVSEECASSLAEGAREKLKATWGLSITGIAGPSGGTKEKPVGTVCIALSNANETHAQTRRFKGDREQVRTGASEFALQWLVTFAD